MYSSILSLTSTLDKGGWLTPRHGCSTPGKETRYPLYRRLGGPQGRCGLVWKVSAGSFAGGKRPMREVEHSRGPGGKIKTAWSYASTSPRLYGAIFS